MSKTTEDILDAAQGLAHTRGYNGFSFRDLAEVVGVKSASVHHHFPTKGVLAAALARRYTNQLMATLDDALADSRPTARLMKKYVSVFRATLEQDGQMCLCGMLAAEFVTLPRPMQTALDDYFEANEIWLAGVLEEGRHAASLQFKGSVSDAAQFIIGSLEGAMLMARSHGGMARFSAATRRLLADFGV